MKRFTDYLLLRAPTQTLLEVSGLFPKDQINALFRKEADNLLPQSRSAAATQSIERFKAIDVVGYIDRSVRSAGVQDHDLDERVQDIAVKLLRGLFKNWKQQPLDARFKLAVTNSVRSIAGREGSLRRRRRDLLDEFPSRSDRVDDDLLDRFVEFVQKRLGDSAVRLLRHRLDEGDTKDLVGTFGLETRYRTKLVVQHIKQAARDFASDDPELSRMIEQAFQDEGLTVKKRFTKSTV